MNKSLFTDSELGLLLQRARSGGPTARTSTPMQKIEPYDFQGGSRLSAGQLANLSEAHAGFSSTLGKSLSSLLGAECKVMCMGAEQMEYGEFVKLAPEGVLFGTLKVQSPEADAFLHAELATILPMVDLMLGGAGNASETPRPMTDV